MWRLLKTLVRETVNDRLPGLAAEVSFWGVFSLFPALLITAGLLGTLDALAGSALAAQAEAQVVAALHRLLTDQGEPVVTAVRGLFHGASGGVLTTAGLIAVWSISSGFSTIIDALDIVYEVPRPRGWFHQRAVAVALGLGSVLVLVLVLLVLVLGPLFGGGRALASALGVAEAWGSAWDWLRAPVAVVALALWATTMFRLGPRRRSRWRSQLPGGLVTAALAVAASFGFQWYAALARQGNQVLGVIGGGLLLMVWLYLLALGLLLGGEVNAVLSRRLQAPAARASGRAGQLPQREAPTGSRLSSSPPTQ